MTHTCDIDLTINVAYRVSIWTIEGDGSVPSPPLKARYKTIAGTMTVDGTPYTASKTISSAADE